MATTQSLTNFIRFTAKDDTARTTVQIRIFGIIVTKASATTRPTFGLANTAGTVIIPTCTLVSTICPPYYNFRPDGITITGLKALQCTNCNMLIQLD